MMDNSEEKQDELQKDKTSYKKYNVFGARDDNIPGSTSRYWKTKQRNKRSVTRHLRCQDESETTDNDLYPGDISSDEIESCDPFNGPGQACEPDEIHSINEEFLDSISDTVENPLKDTAPDSPEEHPIPMLEDATQFYSDEVLVRTLLIMALKLRHNLTYTAAEDIVQLHGVLSDSTMERATKYHWKKMVDDLFSDLTIHHLCPTCESYIGESAGVSIYCDQCDENIDVKLNIKLRNIFVYMSLAQQLKEVFETTDAHESMYFDKRQKHCEYAIEDIFDGAMYKKKMDGQMISINFSVDGVPVFDSSNSSIWPILCTINEFEPIQRRKNVLLCSLWFGQGKPRMSEYLKPFVEESKILDTEGFNYEFKGSTYRKKCQVLVCISDSVARPLLRNSFQYNGEYGCGLCLHPGVMIARGKGFTRVYPLSKDGKPFGEGLRTQEGTIHHARNREKGIKGLSILSEIHSIDIVQSLIADWMHAVALGVCRQFAKLWLDSSNHLKDFYFGHLCDDIDSFLESILPDSQISRTPRKISDRVHWKAHEWTIFLLFYSLPILRAFCPHKYVNHWALLVDGISVLLRESIMPSEIEYSRKCLINFINDVEQLYSREHVSFNVHLLAHLPDSVLNWGPLWTHSSFPYENANQDLLNSVKSSNGVVLQICDTFRVKSAVDKLYIRCSGILTEPQTAFLNKLLGKEKKIHPNLIVNDTGMLGSPSFLDKLPRDQYLALQRLNLNIDEQSVIQCYKRVVVHGEIFHSKSYSRVEKRANYYSLLHTLEIFEIDLFLIVKINGNNSSFAIGRYFDKTNKSFIHGKKLDHLIVLRKRHDNLAAVNTSLLKEKVTLIERDDYETLVACVHPNHFELLT